MLCPGGKGVSLGRKAAYLTLLASNGRGKRESSDGTIHGEYLNKVYTDRRGSKTEKRMRDEEIQLESSEQTIA